MNAAEIVRQVREVYERCQSYQDTGIHTEVTINGPAKYQQRTEIKEFRTRFIRPHLFCFEYVDRAIGPRHEWKRGLIAMRGDTVRQWWSVAPNKDHRVDHIGMAIAGFTGVSGGTSCTIPNMLFHEKVGANALWDAGSHELVVSEDVASVPCWRLRSTWRASRSEDWWIGTKDYLVRRIEETTLFNPSESAQPDALDKPNLRHGSFSVRSVTEYSPAIDLSISDAEFEFMPPE